MQYQSERPTVPFFPDLSGNDYLKASFEKINIHLSQRQIGQFLMYYQLLIEKNKVMNLTAITDYEEVILKHFIDSAMPGFVCNFDFHQPYTMIDVGTGTGFPGIPLKILYPELKILLLDSLKKRVSFLNDLIYELGLEEISTVHARAEDAARDQMYREKYDFCVSRAVANLSSLSEYCLPFVKRGGYFISYKSSNIEQEASRASHAISLLGGNLKEIRQCEIPGTDISRSFVIVKKEKKTPMHYPRKAGVPAKTPL